MTSPQKAKGNNFERQVAKHLSDVFDTNFTRVPTSGAMTGGMNAGLLEKLTKSQKLLLEGDLIKTETSWKFLVGDILINRGKVIKTKTFHYRFTLIGKIFDKQYVKDTYLEPCSIFIKKYFPYNKEGKSNLLKMLEEIDYKAQGICFTSEKEYKPSFLVFLEPRDKPDKTHKRIDKKPKSAPKQTVNRETHDKISSTDESSDNGDENSEHDDNTYFNFKISKTSTPGIYQLYCGKVGKIIKHSIARIEGLRCLKFVQEIFTDDKAQPLVQCEYDTNFKKFIPRKLSTQVKPDEYTDIIYHTHEKM